MASGICRAEQRSAGRRAEVPSAQAERRSALRLRFILVVPRCVIVIFGDIQQVVGQPDSTVALAEVVDRIDFHARRAPAEGAVGRRVVPAAEADQLGPLVLQIKLAKRVRDVLKRRRGQTCDYTRNLTLK